MPAKTTSRPPSALPLRVRKGQRWVWRSKRVSRADIVILKREGTCRRGYPPRLVPMWRVRYVDASTTKEKDGFLISDVTLRREWSLAPPPLAVEALKDLGLSEREAE